MALGSRLDLPQLRPALLPLPDAPVPARKPAEAAAGGEARSSPLPFHGGSGRIAAVAADAALPPASSRHEAGGLVQFPPLSRLGCAATNPPGDDDQPA
jgi:hypothetical protein